MKKIIALVIVIGIFVFGATTVWGNVTCSIQTHNMTRGEDRVTVAGKVKYNSNNKLSQWYYEMNYVKAYYECPHTSNWCKTGTRTEWIEAYSAIGNARCWQEQITNVSNKSGELWSNSYAITEFSQAIVTGLYGGESRDNISAISSKSA